jgi:tetratricopeptide (TPR) repeat protein
MPNAEGEQSHPSLKRKRRSLRFRLGCLLLMGSLLLAGGWAACEGWAAWQEHLAGQALADDRVDEARRHIDLALQVRRNHTSTLLLASRIRRLQGAYSDAEQYLFRCGQLDGMSEAVQLEWLLLRCQQGEVDELAPQLLALVKQQHPEAPAILETLAAVYIRQTRYQEALRCLNLWLERIPDSVRALSWHGWLADQLDHREQALDDYQRLVERQPERTDFRLRLAQVLIECTRYTEALPHLERLHRELPDDPEARVALAQCRAVQFKTDEARALLDAVLKDHPDHFDALLQRGDLELNIEQHPAEAEPWLRKALRVKPSDTEACYLLYQCLDQQPDRKPEAERARTRWLQVREIHGRLIHLLRHELPAHPKDAELACEAGRLLLQLNEEKQGLFWLYRALAIHPGHAPSRRALLAYYERTNRPEKAAEQRQLLSEPRPRER